MKVILDQDDWSPHGHFRASEFAQEIPDARAKVLIQHKVAKKATAADIQRAKDHAAARRRRR